MNNTYHNNDSGGEQFTNDRPEPDQVLYRNKGDAQQAAKARGCEGTHADEVDGETHYMPCKTHSGYHDDSGSDMDTGSNTYVGGPFDLSNIAEGGIGGGSTDSDGGMMDSSLTEGGFLEGRPREGAEPVSFGRDPANGEFDADGGDPLGLERDPDSGRIGVDPYVVGNAGQFNSPYDSADNEDEKEKYK